jgi:hypothetical protein
MKTAKKQLNRVKRKQKTNNIVMLIHTMSNFMNSLKGVYYKYFTKKNRVDEREVLKK